MQSHEDIWCYLFKTIPDMGDGEQAEASIDTDTRDEPKEESEYWVCRRCQLVITTPSDGIWLFGGHEHTFANPSGIVFQIGCFGRARGCAHIGSASEDFTWFKGYFWQVAVCRQCTSHIGWLFTAKDRDPFHGLILDRLFLVKG